jgi:hypothetical protein
VIRDKLEAARRLIFLGFAYHRLNLTLLWPGKPQSTEPRTAQCFGTAYGISTSNTEVIANEISSRSGIIGHFIKLRRELTCAELLQEYWRSLSLR